MTRNDDDLVQALSALSDMLEDDEGEQRLLRFRAAIQHMQDDPAEAARIDKIVADISTDEERDVSAEQIWVAPERDWGRAEDSLRRLRDRYLHVHGRYDSLTLATVVGHSQAMVALGKPRETQEQLLSVMNDLREGFGERSSLYLRAVFLLAQTSAQLGQYEEAVKRYEAAFSGQRDVLGRKHPETLRSQFELGVALKMSGRGRRARAMFREVRELASESVGRNTDLYWQATFGKMLVTLPTAVWWWASGRVPYEESEGLQPLIERIDRYDNDTTLEDLQEVLDALAMCGPLVFGPR